MYSFIGIGKEKIWECVKTYNVFFWDGGRTIFSNFWGHKNRQLSKPQLNHNSTQPNITLSWDRHENDFAHPTTATTPHHSNSMSAISHLLLTKYQSSGAGGTRSPPATPHRLQHPTACLIQPLGYCTL